MFSTVQSKWTTRYVALNSIVQMSAKLFLMRELDLLGIALYEYL